MSIASLYPSINPSLLLDFANSKVLDPRITFTRTTTATYYDGVTTAVAEQNLLTYSQEFNQSAWAKTLGSITANADTAPDGTATADLFTPSDPASRVQQSFNPIGAVQYVFTVYLRSATGSSFSTDLIAWRDSPFNQIAITTITVTTTWQRFTLTFTALDTTTHSVNIGGGGSLSTGENIYLWGAQLEQRSSATAYTATTTQAITNYIPVLQTAAAGQARFDHNPTTGESLGLLIEEARTNSLTYSSDFSNAAWVKSGNTITSNTIIAPDGTLTGDKVVPASSQTYNQNYQNKTLSTGTNYAISCYAKKGEYSYLNLGFIYNTSAYAGAQFDLNAGSVLYTRAANTGFSVVSTSITPVGNGWYFCTVVATTGFADSYIGVAASNSTWTSGPPDVAIAGNGFSGIYIWGAQVEAGSFATSYIPTVASSVTRNADAASMTGTNFSSWFNNGEGTVYFEAQPMYTGTVSVSLNLWLWDGTTSNMIAVGQNSGSGQALYVDALVRINGSDVAYGSTTTGVTTASAFKSIAAYEFNNTGAYLNGASFLTDTSCTIPVVNQWKFGGNYGSSNTSNGWVRKLSYYPQRLSATNLAALTT